VVMREDEMQDRMQLKKSGENEAESMKQKA
jgi:hypothetical protein